MARRQREHLTVPGGAPDGTPLDGSVSNQSARQSACRERDPSDWFARHRLIAADRVVCNTPFRLLCDFENEAEIGSTAVRRRAIKIACGIEHRRRERILAVTSCREDVQQGFL